MRYTRLQWLWALAIFADKSLGRLSPPIKASIQASWVEAPLIVQILESASLEVPTAVFDLFSSLSTSYDPANTAKQVYDIALEVIQDAEVLQGVGQVPALELSLATREASPKIQAFYEHYASLNKTECDCWAKVPGRRKPICEPDRLKRYIDDKLDGYDIEEPRLLSFDHILEANDHIPKPTLVLYADPLATECFQMHNTLRESALEGRIRYVLRWKPSASVHSEAKPLVLNGYGAYLDVKKSDYLVVDDRQVASEESTRPQGTVESAVSSKKDSIHSEENAPDTLEPLTRTEIISLGDKATQYILESKDPLSAFVSLSQDFPKFASKLSQEWVSTGNSTILNELETIRATKIEGGQSIVWMNGLQLPETDLDTFSLQRLLRQERGRIQDLIDLGLSQRQAVDILSHPAISLKQSSSAAPQHNGRITADALGILFDASDRQEGGGLIMWWNDLERDKRYRQWPRSLGELVRPAYPGQLPSVGRNIFNIILVLDLKYTRSFITIAESILPFIQRNLPFHMGLVPLLHEDEISRAVAVLLRYVFNNFGKLDAMEFVMTLSELSTGLVDIPSVKKAYNTILNKHETLKDGSKPLDYEDVVALQSDWITKVNAYARRLDLPPSTTGYAFINGKYATLDKSLQKQLQTHLNIQLQFVQHSVYYEDLTEEMDVENFFYDLPSAFRKRSSLIFGDENVQPKFAIWSKSIDLTGCTSSGQVDTATNIMYIVAEGDADVGLAAKEFAESSKDTVVCIVSEWPEDSAEVPVAENASYIVLNSRIIGPFPPNSLTKDDFETLVAFETQQRSEAFAEAFKDADLDITALDLEKRLALVAGVTSIVSRSYLKDPAAGIFDTSVIRRSHGYKQIGANHTTIQFGDEEAYARFVVLVDPLSTFGQRRAELFRGLAQIPGISLQLFLNPVGRLRELPLKRFYRHTFKPKLQFETNGQIADTKVEFKGVPTRVLLTLGLEVHPSWLAFPLHSIHDLDNIRLSDLSGQQAEDGISAVFKLENIIIEGHCRETKTGAPPRGLQLVLEARSDAKDVDSLVMANLGYTQLKANPGSFDLSIRPGRSSQVFRLQSAGTSGVEARADVSDANDNDLPVDSTIDVTTFEGITVYPRFVRQPGMEKIDLLDGNVPSTNLKTGAGALVDQVVSKWKNIFGNQTQDVVKPKTKGKAEINIFTVASGLLYERMAFLMVLSVLRHTESTCKFWFISNFLSPAFKSFIPHMAAHYNFEYELVTYKWPHWLRAQTEKQRTIWGYKILFLDVLFPLELDRVIFVDSDQIVRTDLKQLVDLDLQGAPYAYAPMGDDRKEMDGFRFWKKGYWADHLRGLPYHISALYVVDLDRFRQIAAGDILRGQYQTLSADPNSLANLDQDLPNNMQHQIPIHTLDRSWLWCETWCSDESLADAKTIDLCNNPMTHEPKLARAKRLIPEWTVYDAEIADLARNISRAQSSNTDAAAFVDEASELGQAKLQQTEYVEEGTGGGTLDILPDGPAEKPPRTDHTKDEL